MLAPEVLAQVDAQADRLPPPKSLKPPNAVILAAGGTFTPQPIAWLWQYWLGLGKLHVLAGAPGQGKTTIALAMAATVTAGGRWPDGRHCEPGNVLIWSGEDDPADTLLPRLIAMGADRDRVYFIVSARINGVERPFDPAQDARRLEKAIEAIGGIRMLIVDPIVSAVAGDSHKNTEVRRALQPLVDLATRCHCAVVGISHFSKGGQGQDPTQRVVGSIAFGAVARIVMVAAKVRGNDGQGTRILARSKSNIGPDDGGFEYTIAQVEALPGIQASRVEWGQMVKGTARELLTDPNADEAAEGIASDAVEMLAAELTSETWTNSEFASEPLKHAGFTKKQIWSASKKLQVIRKKGGMADGWYWRLPDSADPDSTMGCPEDSGLTRNAEGSTEDSEDSNVLNGESSQSSGCVESS